MSNHRRRKKGPLKKAYLCIEGQVVQISYDRIGSVQEALTNTPGVSLKNRVPQQRWIQKLIEQYPQTRAGNAHNLINKEVPFGGRLLSYWHSDGLTCYMYEWQPGIYTILESTIQSGRIISRNISLPYFYILIRMSDVFQEMMVYFSNEPVRRLDAPLYHTPFPNTFPDNPRSSHVCLGRSVVKDTQDHYTQIVQVIENFFATSFTGRPYAELVDSKNFPKTWMAWENMTRHNPRFALQVHWREIGWNFGQALGIRKDPKYIAEKPILDRVFYMAQEVRGEEHGF